MDSTTCLASRCSFDLYRRLSLMLPADNSSPALGRIQPSFCRIHLPLSETHCRNFGSTFNHYVMNTLNSIGAVLAGFVFIGVTHSAIDALLEAVGVLPKGNLYVSTPLILFVIFYRALFGLFGCY